MDYGYESQIFWAWGLLQDIMCMAWLRSRMRREYSKHPVSPWGLTHGARRHQEPEQKDMRPRPVHREARITERAHMPCMSCQESKHWETHPATAERGG